MESFLRSLFAYLCIVMCQRTRMSMAKFIVDAVAAIPRKYIRGSWIFLIVSMCIPIRCLWMYEKSLNFAANKYSRVWKSNDKGEQSAKCFLQFPLFYCYLISMENSTLYTPLLGILLSIPWGTMMILGR